MSIYKNITGSENEIRQILRFYIIEVFLFYAVYVEIPEADIKYTTSYAENGVPEKDGEDNFNRANGKVAVLMDSEWMEFKAN